MFGFLCFGLDSLPQGSFSLLTASAVNSDSALFAKPANNFLTESPSIALLEGNSIVAIAPPSTIDGQVLGSVMGSLNNETRSDGGNNIVEYLVEEGDSLSSIASKYNISLNTLLLANDLNSKSKIQVDQKLIILPITGVLYHVNSGDTLGEIAKLYKGKPSEIVEVNNLSDEGNIFIGDILIIPDGKIPSQPTYFSQTPIGSSSFIRPCANCSISQGLHWYNAIDFAGKCGDPLYAVAAGTVQRVEYGWNGGAGNYVRIVHDNGVITMYGHVQTALVSPGQPVVTGDKIALMGGKPGMEGAGISTGCHVHFDVRGARNPFAK